MHIDKQRVLDMKMTKPSFIEEQFSCLKNDDSPINRINFFHTFRSQPSNVIISNLEYICDIPIVGAIDFIKSFIKSNDISMDKLDEYIQMLKRKLECERSDSDYIGEINNLISYIENIKHERCSNEYLKNDTLTKMSIKRVDIKGIFESYFADDIDIIINNINYSPDTIVHFEKMVRSIKMSKSPNVIMAIPSLYAKTTDLVFAINNPSMNRSNDVILSFPEVIARKAIELKASTSQLREINKVINIQIGRVYTELKTNGEQKYTLYTTYVDHLREASRILTKTGKITLESIAEMQPDIKLYEDCVIEDVVAELEDAITNMVFDDNEDEFDEKTLENYIRAYKTLESYIKYSSVEEDSKVTKGIIKTAHKAEKVSRKVAGGIQSSGSSINRVKTAVNKVSDPIINTINKTINDIKKMDSDERRERIITGQFRYKLFNTLTKAIAGVAAGKLVGVLIGGGSVVAPILTLIGTITAFALNKYLDKKERQKILYELESELKIVDEKIEDAKSDNERQKKYELMRIKQKLEKDIERIKFHLD